MAKIKKSKRLQKQVADQKTITMITKEYRLNGTIYLLDSEKETKITKEQYENILGVRGVMEHLGGKERYYKGYNQQGQLVINKVISTSPDKDQKIYRYFIF